MADRILERVREKADKNSLKISPNDINVTVTEIGGGKIPLDRTSTMASSRRVRRAKTR